MSDMAATLPIRPKPLLFACGGCGERAAPMHALAARLSAAGAVECASSAALMAAGSARGATLREAVLGGRPAIALDGCDEDCALRCLRQCLAGRAGECASLFSLHAGANDGDAIARRVELLADWLGD